MWLGLGFRSLAEGGPLTLHVTAHIRAGACYPVHIFSYAISVNTLNFILKNPQFCLG